MRIVIFPWKAFSSSEPKCSNWGHMFIPRWFGLFLWSGEIFPLRFTTNQVDIKTWIKECLTHIWVSPALGVFWLVLTSKRCSQLERKSNFHFKGRKAAESTIRQGQYLLTVQSKRILVASRGPFGQGSWLKLKQFGNNWRKIYNCLASVGNPTVWWYIRPDYVIGRLEWAENDKEREREREKPSK